MVRLADLDPALADALRSLEIPPWQAAPWITPPPLARARIAIVSTAGLHRAADTPFAAGARDFRLIPADVDPADLRMSHVSVNFDRSGFQQDTSVVFPLEHLRTLAAGGEIGAVAPWHYSFMGATAPDLWQETGSAVARQLRAASVDAALLVPV